MEYNLKKLTNYSLATITENKSDLVAAYITIDIHNSNTLNEQTLQLIYSEALLAGAGKLSRAEFLDAINKLGASLNISISDGKLQIILKSLKTKFPALVALFSAVIKQPTFSKLELTRIKKTTINELHEAKEDSKQVSLLTLINSFYGAGDRRFTHDIDELIESVNAVKVTDLQKLHQLSVSQNWTISIAGDTKSIKSFAAAINILKADLSPAISLNGLHQPKPALAKVIFKDIPSKSNLDINIGLPLPISLHHKDYLALSFTIMVLAKWGGFSGRLMSTVREKEGLTYMIYGRLEGFVGEEQGYLRIVTFFAPDKAVQGIKSTLREIETLYRKGISNTEFQKFKTIFETQQTLLNDSVYKLLNDLHAFHCQGFSLEEMQEFKDKIKNLSLSEVNAAIKDYLNPNSFSISCAGPITKVKKDIEKIIK